MFSVALSRRGSTRLSKVASSSANVRPVYSLNSWWIHQIYCWWTVYKSPHIRYTVCMKIYITLHLLDITSMDWFGRKCLNILEVRRAPDSRNSVRWSQKFRCWTLTVSRRTNIYIYIPFGKHLQWWKYPFSLSLMFQKWWLCLTRKRQKPSATKASNWEKQRPRQHHRHLQASRGTGRGDKFSIMFAPSRFKQDRMRHPTVSIRKDK